MEEEEIKINHIPDISRYNSNYYTFIGFSDEFNIVHEECSDLWNGESIYRIGIIKCREMKWLDKWFMLNDSEITKVTKDSFKDLEIKDSYIWT